MSSEKGNVKRTRTQKHQNRFSFKNDLHDTNIRTKRINEIQICRVCEKCKAILEWKIKYKKYKPLKAAKSCNRCLQKTVKEAYHTMCNLCAKELRVCPKCAVPMVLSEEQSTNENITNTEQLFKNDEKLKNFDGKISNNGSCDSDQESCDTSEYEY